MAIIAVKMSLVVFFPSDDQILKLLEAEPCFHLDSSSFLRLK